MMSQPLTKEQCRIGYWLMVAGAVVSAILLHHYATIATAVQR